LVFEKNGNFFRRKSQKIVIITSAPGWAIYLIFWFSLLCDPHYFGLRLEGRAVSVKTDFHSLVVIPLISQPLNFKTGFQSFALM
jgi:hypothetical protein